MKTTNQTPVSPAPSAAYNASPALLWTLACIRTIGYVLLFFSLIDFIDTIVPPLLTNPNWEFQTFGQIVERVPVVLLGFAMVYAGREIGRNPKERFILPALSWIALVIGIMYIVLIPLGVVNTNRLLNLNNQQVVQVNENMARVKKVGASLKKATTADELQQLLAQDLGVTNPVPDLNNPQRANEIRQQLGNVVQGGESQLTAQLEQLKLARLNILKKSVKWNLGSFLAAVLFIYIWRLSRRRV
jgi:hypothetical protein